MRNFPCWKTALVYCNPKYALSFSTHQKLLPYWQLVCNARLSFQVFNQVRLGMYCLGMALQDAIASQTERVFCDPHSLAAARASAFPFVGRYILSLSKQHCLFSLQGEQFRLFAGSQGLIGELFLQMLVAVTFIWTESSPPVMAFHFKMVSSFNNCSRLVEGSLSGVQVFTLIN